MTLEDGTELWYCHQTAFAVKPGDRSSGGQTDRLVGSTGNTTGPHLHLEVRPGGGDAVDPYAALSSTASRPGLSVVRRSASHGGGTKAMRASSSDDNAARCPSGGAQSFSTGA